MEFSTKPSEEQREIPTKPAAGDVMPKNQAVSASRDRASGEQASRVRKDLHAAQKLARKKRMKAAHHRRLNASHAKG